MLAMRSDPRRGAISISGRPLALDRSERLLVGYSVKNRSFDQEFFSTVGKLTLRCFSALVVVIFDVPYSYNDAARRGREVPTADEVAKCVKIGDERARMVRKAFSSIGFEGYEIRRWSELNSASVIGLRQELLSALERNAAFRNELIGYSKAWTGLHDGCPDRFLGFQVSEMPVLIDLYYRQGLLVDIYPGQLNDFFFKLESGVWTDLLPTATRLTAGKRLSCLEIKFSSTANDRDTLTDISSSAS